MNEFTHFRIDQRENVTVVQLLDSHLLDRLVINELRDELIRFIKTRSPQLMLINFDCVLRFGTEAVNLLLLAQRQVAASGGEMRLCGMHEGIQEIFKVLRLEGPVFSIFSSKDDALATFC